MVGSNAFVVLLLQILGNRGLVENRAMQLLPQLEDCIMCLYFNSFAVLLLHILGNRELLRLESYAITALFRSLCHFATGYLLMKRYLRISLFW